MFNRKNILIILIVLIVVILPIILAIVFGKIRLQLPFMEQSPSPKIPLRVDTSKVALYCPSLNEYCTSGQMVTIDGNNLGFGANLQPGSPVITAFNGILTFSQTQVGNQQIQTVKLDNPEFKTYAMYYFVGGVLPKSELKSTPNGYVKAGTTFGKVTEDISAYKTSLLFQLFKYGETTPEQLQLNSFTLGK